MKTKTYKAGPRKVHRLGEDIRTAAAACAQVAIDIIEIAQDAPWLGRYVLSQNFWLLALILGLLMTGNQHLSVTVTAS